MKLPLILAGLHFSRGKRRETNDLECGANDLEEKSSSSSGTRKRVSHRMRTTERRHRRDLYGDERRDLNSSDVQSNFEDNGNDNTDDERRLHESLVQSDTSASSAPLRSPSLYARFRKRLSAIKAFILQTDGADDDANIEHANLRLLPILSGIIIPFSILLEIPGLTGHWYIITEENKVVYSRENSALLDTGLGISMACALLANVAIIIRFLEKKVRTATLVAIIALSIHDIINIIAVTTFGVIHRFNDGFTFGQSFWFTLCSTIASLGTNITLLIDYIQTPNFARASSGLTRKQRSLVIVVVLLLVWIALGGLANSLLMELSFIDGMYFTIVVIETIGFGDIVPRSSGARVFCALHATIGILNLALAVGICNDTIIESFKVTYKKHLNAFDERRKVHRERRRGRNAEKIAVERQLARAGLPVYVYRASHFGGSRVALRKRHLNVEALSANQKEAAMQEARDILRLEVEKLGKRSASASHSSIDSSITESLQKEFTVKLTIVWSLFLTFWLIGAAVFHATEGWPFGSAMWFCFEAFTTIGFGDQTPDTPAGRSVFIVWALLGVGTMTILISVLSEAYSSRYRKVIQASKNRTLSHTEEVVREDQDGVEGKDRIRLPSTRRRNPRQYHDALRQPGHGAYRRHASCPDIASGQASTGSTSAFPIIRESGCPQQLSPESNKEQEITRVSAVDFAKTISPSSHASP